MAFRIARIWAKCLPWNGITTRMSASESQRPSPRARDPNRMICSGANRSTSCCVKACKASRMTSGEEGGMTMSIFWPAMPAQCMKARFSILEISAVGTLASVLRQSPRAIKIRYFPVTARTD